MTSDTLFGPVSDDMSLSKPPHTFKISIIPIYIIIVIISKTQKKKKKKTLLTDGLTIMLKYWYFKGMRWLRRRHRQNKTQTSPDASFGPPVSFFINLS